MKLKKLWIYFSKFLKCFIEIIKYINLFEKNWVNGFFLFLQKVENSNGVEEVKNMENCEFKLFINVLKVNEKDLFLSLNFVNMYRIYNSVKKWYC